MTNPETQDLKQFVEGSDGILVIRGSGNCRSWNGIRYRPGMSAKNVGSRKLSMNVATIPPGGVARAHIHVDFEVMLYILEGRVRHEYGPGLTKTVANEARRLHLHRARGAARSVQHERLGAGGGRRRALGRDRVGEHHSLRPERRALIHAIGGRRVCQSVCAW